MRALRRLPLHDGRATDLGGALRSGHARHQFSAAGRVQVTYRQTYGHFKTDVRASGLASGAEIQLFCWESPKRVIMESQLLYIAPEHHLFFHRGTAMTRSCTSCRIPTGVGMSSRPIPMHHSGTPPVLPTRSTWAHCWAAQWQRPLKA